MYKRVLYLVHQCHGIDIFHLPFCFHSTPSTNAIVMHIKRETKQQLYKVKDPVSFYRKYHYAMVSMLASGSVDRRFDPPIRSNQGV